MSFLLYFVSGATVASCSSLDASSLHSPPSPPPPPRPPVCNEERKTVSELCPSAQLNWNAFTVQLYDARRFVWTGDSSGSEARLYKLLVLVTKDFSIAFQCPVAVAATFFSLAQNFAFQHRMRRALAMVHMGFITLRDRGFREIAYWPIKGEDMLLAGKSLVERTRNLDDESILLATPPSFRLPGRPRIAIVSICAYAKDEPVRVLGSANHELYAKLHGYDLFAFTEAAQIAPNVASGMNVRDGVHKTGFWKVNAVKNVLDMRNPVYEWVLWVDCAAHFMDPNRTIDSVIEMYSGNQTVASRLGPAKPGDHPEVEKLRQRLHPPNPKPVSLIFATDSTGINNGVWLMKNTNWSHGFLRRWWNSDILRGAGKNHICSDQSTMQHELLYRTSMKLDPLWDSVEGPLWPSVVRVAAQQHLQSFHKAAADNHVSREWQDGDFIKHFYGCSPHNEACKLMYRDAFKIFVGKVQAMRAVLDSR